MGMVACVTIAHAAAQTATLQVTTRLVVLDVVVLDKSGHPVTGLDRSQFTVYENKIPQTIRSFDPPASHTMPTGSAQHPLVHSTADLARIGNAPVNILVFDEVNTKWEAMAYARLQMQAYLKRQPEVLPEPTQLMVARGTRFTVLHDYTQSRADLLRAIKDYLPQFPSQLMRGSSGNTNIELLEETLGTLMQIADASRGTPGRKNVIWVGSGYPSINTTMLAFDDDDKLEAIIRRTVDRMLAARVTLSMIDPEGVQTGLSDAGTADESGAVSTLTSSVGPFEGKLDFAKFAPMTGGQIIANRNDVDVAIAQSVHDSSLYYTLGYVPADASSDPDKYHSIRIAMKDHSLHAVTRDGYFAAADAVDPAPAVNEKPADQLRFDIVSAAQTRLVYNGLKVDAARVDDEYKLLVNTRDLHWAPQNDGAQLTEVTVMTVYFDIRDKRLRSDAAELKARIAGDVETHGSEQVGFKVPMKEPQGTARIRFVVRDAATGVLGTADILR